jgi:pyruvate-ferredoxin/flavodoxin oxidoreductase
MTRYVTIDGNEAAAQIAFKTNEVIAIYPITPSSGMGELSDAWAAAGKRNIWGGSPLVEEMQSEGGAAGAVHGALQAGALTTTFTASQGLLLMIPNMYKIAGELTPTVFHISARSLAAQALSIFGDHSDVMACRGTGWGMLFGNNVQEVMDFALISQTVSLESRIPFLNIFDGFRTSHEVQKVEEIPDEVIREMIDDKLVLQHRQRSLNPVNPVVRGTAQNPDVYFQGRETVNQFYDKTPDIVQAAMDKFAKLTGRQYKLFDYVGAPNAERIVVIMGSGAEAAEEAVKALNEQGEKVGLLKVRLYRPFCTKCFAYALPASVKAVVVLDRTKEPGAAGEPLYKEFISGLAEAMADGFGKVKSMPKVVGGRYGLSSKEFTPGMVKAALDNLKQDKPKNHFTLGIEDDVTHSHLDYDPDFLAKDDKVQSAVFWGLGSDGTVGANKNSIKIIGEETDNYCQGYFVYDSKKSGSVTTSHLRFGPNPIKSTYLIKQADFVGIHQFGLIETNDVLASAAEGATVLLNSRFGPDTVWDHLPQEFQKTVLEKKLKLYVLDGYSVADEVGMGGRINTIMQTAYFALSNVLPTEEAITKIKDAIQKTYGKRGKEIVEMNNAAVDKALAHLHEVKVPSQADSKITRRAPVPARAPDFVQKVTAEMIAGRGDLIPVSQLPVDGTYPVGTTKYEKRGISPTAPEWEPDICTQCGACVLVCPHSVIRAKVVDENDLANAPEGFKIAEPKYRRSDGKKFTIQVSTLDCTGCNLCIDVCPAKSKQEAGRKAINMEPIPKGFEEDPKWDFFLQLPDDAGLDLKYKSVKDVMLKQPYFEFSGACAGCGETPYVRLMTQLFGDRMLIANATGCSSIYGGNLPTTPYTTDKEGRGPAWSNSLFEDNAEFGMGFRLAIDARRDRALELLKARKDKINEEAMEILSNGAAPQIKRQTIVEVKNELQADPAAKDLLEVIDALDERSVWILGGDGWAYDIGYGGLDHVLASGRNVNVLVLDTEVYSNTGGQASKATSRAAVAKFAAGGKPRPKKALGEMMMTYGTIYVAQIAMGADDGQTIKALLEAEAYDGPSIVIAYSHCIAHGIDMAKGLDQQRLAVESGHWPLYRFNPERTKTGKNPFQLDSEGPRIPLEEYMYQENRYRMLLRTDPEAAKLLLAEAKKDVDTRWHALQKMTENH